MHSQEELEGIVRSAVKDFANSLQSGEKVMADMSALVEVTSSLPLANLEYWERLIRWEYYSHVTPNSAAFLTWIDLCSSDGYRREKTLRALTGPAPNSFFFAIALRRLNDWVPKVRKAAREKLPLLAQASSPTQVVDVLFPTLSHWSSWGRVEEADKQVFFSIIADEDIAEVIKSRLISSPVGALTLILAQVGRISALDGHLGDIAKHAIQPALRAKAYRSLLEGKMAWFEGRTPEWIDKRYGVRRMRPVLAERTLSVASPFLETLKMAGLDKSPIVRRVAAEMLIRERANLGEKVAYELANLFIADSSPSVVERGLFVLKKLAGS